MTEIRKVTTVKFFDENDNEFTFEPIEDTIKTEWDGGKEIVRYLTRDEYPTSPDEWGDDGLFLVHYHNQFYIDRKRIVSKEEIRDFYNNEETEIQEDYHIFPVKSYIHSGVHLSLGKGGFPFDTGGWDTSHVGACLASKKEFPNEKKAENACDALMDDWNKYLSGDVYCVVKDVRDVHGKVEDYEVVCGYYGSEHAKENLYDI